MTLAPPVVLKYFEDFKEFRFTDKLYEAMNVDDLSEVVFTVMEGLRFLNLIPNGERAQKCRIKSTAHSISGFEAQTREAYETAYTSYNEALMYAPYNTLEMQTAYDNRSLLFFLMQSGEACMKDIDICLTLDCSPELIAKLEQRKHYASELLLADKKSTTAFCESFFCMNPPNSIDIPCARADVGAVVKSDFPKAIATNDIKVGAVLAVETAFVSHTLFDNIRHTCHHCQKIDSNLTPCKGCVHAMFCSKHCEKISINTYHSVLCQLDLFTVLESPDDFILILKCVLKLRHNFSSWQEMIDASLTMGAKRLAGCPMKAVFDGSNPYSILCCNKQRHFIHGRMFNGSVACAVILHYLTKLPSFFPKDNAECTAAMRAVARIMMHLHLHDNPTFMEIRVPNNTQIRCNTTTNVGIFSFIGKLDHSCNPNVIPVCIHNKIALVAVQPIKKGTELTTCYMRHFREGYKGQQNRIALFKTCGIVCDCNICSGAWALNRNYPITDAQKRVMDKVKLGKTLSEFTVFKAQETYIKACKALAFLNDIPFSKEYECVYQSFQGCILYLQSEKCQNYVLQQ